MIEDRPVVREPNLISEERCSRCEEKNRVRRGHDLPERNARLADGERVTLICGYDADPDQTRGWVVSAVHHADHPELDKEKAALPGQAQALVTATVDRTGWTYQMPALTQGEESDDYHVEDRSVARDVELIWFSSAGNGQEREPVVELDDDGMADPKPTDPIREWPEEENEWRREILREHGGE